MAERVTSLFGGHIPCRRRIKMSPLCQLEMTLPGGFPGGIWGDGSADERSGAEAAGGAAGFGSAPADKRSGGATAEAGAPPGVPAAESVSDRGRCRPDVEAAWPSEQPSQARGGSGQSAGDHWQAVLGFRPDPSGREAARGARDRARPRDAAAMDG